MKPKPPFTVEFVPHSQPELHEAIRVPVAGHYRIKDDDDNAICFSYDRDHAAFVVGALNRDACR